jgi:uncharacterized protein with PQ loop repeat
MKHKFLGISKFIFAFGFLVSGVGFIYQGIEIIRIENAQSISLVTFIIFLALHINGIFYSFFIAKDKMLIMGTILNALACAFIITLKLYYG